METQTVENKKEVDLNKVKVESYLNNVSKHLFLTESGKFLKAFPIQFDGQLHFVKMTFDGEGNDSFAIYNAEHYVKNYNTDAKCVIGDIIFPPHGEKLSSITNFKAMKEKIAEIKELVEKKFDGNNRKEIQQEVSKFLVGLKSIIKE